MNKDVIALMVISIICLLAVYLIIRWICGILHGIGGKLPVLLQKVMIMLGIGLLVWIYFEPEHAKNTLFDLLSWLTSSPEEPRPDFYSEI